MEREQLIALQQRLAEAQVSTADPKSRTVFGYQEGTFKGKSLERFKQSDGLIRTSIEGFMATLGVNWSLSVEFPDRRAGNTSNDVSYTVNYGAPSESVGGEQRKFSFQYNPGGRFTVEHIDLPLMKILSRDRKWRTDPLEMARGMEDPRSRDWYISPVRSLSVTPEIVEAIMKIAIVNSRKVF